MKRVLFVLCMLDFCANVAAMEDSDSNICSGGPFESPGLDVRPIHDINVDRLNISTAAQAPVAAYPVDARIALNKPYVIGADFIGANCGKSRIFSCNCIVGAIAVPDYIQVIFDGCLKDVLSLKKVTFSPDSALKIIGISAFEGSNIESIELPVGLEEIKNNSFNNCKNLKFVSFGGYNEIVNNQEYNVYNMHIAFKHACAELKCIGDKAFANTAITQIIIPPTLERLGAGAFGKCINLECLIFASRNFDGGYQLKSIGDYAFCETKVQYVGIPDTVETIGEYCFARCNELRKIRLTDPKITNINEGLLFEHSSWFRFLYYDTKWPDECDIPGNLSYIGAGAFLSCKKLLYVMIPNGVTEVTQRCFEGCASLYYVIFGPNTKLSRIENSAFAACGSELLYLSITENVRLKEISSQSFSASGLCEISNILLGLTYIPDRAFGLCSKICAVTIPNSVSVLYMSCFFRCVELRWVDFQPGSCLRVIGEKAFFGTSISNIEFPDSLQQLSVYCFAECKQLSNITFGYGSNLRMVGTCAFPAVATVTAPANLHDLLREHIPNAHYTTVVAPQ